jgi:hypothetical protein
MIDVPDLIGPAANNPTPLTRDLRFSHSRFRPFSLISSSFFNRSRLALSGRCKACTEIRAERRKAFDKQLHISP